MRFGRLLLEWLMWRVEDIWMLEVFQIVFISLEVLIPI